LFGNRNLEGRDHPGAFNNYKPKPRSFLKVTLVSAAVLFTLLLAMLVWIARQPPAPQPKVSLRFIGYTNDTSNRRVAIFTVSNAGPSTAQLLSGYRVYLHDASAPSRRTRVSSGYLPRGAARLRPAASETLAVTPPTNQLPWYVLVSFRADEPPIRDIADSVLEGARSLGIRVRYRQPRYAAMSERLTE